MELEEVKLYLKQDYTDDDLYIQSLIDIAQIYVDKCVGEAYKTDVKLAKLATLVQYKLIDAMYSDRSVYIDSNISKDKMVETIFQLLSEAGDIV